MRLRLPPPASKKIGSGSGAALKVAAPAAPAPQHWFYVDSDPTIQFDGSRLKPIFLNRFGAISIVNSVYDQHSDMRHQGADFSENMKNKHAFVSKNYFYITILSIFLQFIQRCVIADKTWRLRLRLRLLFKKIPDYDYDYD